MVEKLDKIIGRVLKVHVEELSDDLTMARLQSWDSLQHMELITEIEQQFEILFTGDEIADLVSIGAIRSLVQAKVGE